MSDKNSKQNRFQEDVERLVQAVTLKSLPLQRQSFVCSTQCFDTHGEKYTEIGQCVQKCQTDVSAFAERVQNELQTLQKDIELCQTKCGFSFAGKKDKQSADEIGALERCQEDCLERARPDVPAIQKRLFEFAKNCGH